jgi:hypothetical protein
MRAGSGQILDWPFRRRRNRRDMIPDPACLAREEQAGVLEQDIALPEVSPKGSRRKKPVEVTFEDHPVERVDRSRD